MLPQNIICIMDAIVPNISTRFLRKERYYSDWRDCAVVRFALVLIDRKNQNISSKV